MRYRRSACHRRHRSVGAWCASFVHLQRQTSRGARTGQGSCGETGRDGERHCPRRACSRSPSTLHYRVPLAEYLSRVAVADGGLITVTTQDTGANPDPVFVLVPVESRNGDVVWSCQVFQGDPALVPSSCRNDSLAAHDALPESSGSSSVIGIR